MSLGNFILTKYYVLQNYPGVAKLSSSLKPTLIIKRGLYPDLTHFRLNSVPKTLYTATGRIVVFLSKPFLFVIQAGTFTKSLVPDCRGGCRYTPPFLMTSAASFV